MKNIYSFCCLILAASALLLSSCQEDEKRPAKPGTVRFTLQQRPSGGAANGRVGEELPDGSILHVSIKTAGGEEVYTLYGLTLVNMGDYVVSEPLALNVGDYVLTEFIVTHGQVSYVAPKEGSPLAEWVDDPLPIEFSVEDNVIAGLNVQVLPFDETSMPQDFGYVGFDIDVAPYPFFNLSVFAPSGSGFAFIPARTYILQGTDTVYNKALPARTNKIAFVGDLYDDTFTVYKLVIEQPGYGRYEMDFRIEALQQLLISNGKKALEVTLQPAFTFVTEYTEGAAFNLYGGSLGNLTVDWGDGTVEPLTPAPWSESYYLHEYADNIAHHFVSIYGDDLGNIVEFNSAYDMGSMREVSLEHLPALQKFRMVMAQAPPVVDFSNNSHLGDIQLYSCNARAIVLAEDASLSRIDLSGNGRQFLQSSLDHVIDVSHRAAVEGRVPVGSLGLVTQFEIPPSEPARMIVTPSPEALEKLRALRDVYGWSISPDDF